MDDYDPEALPANVAQRRILDSLQPISGTEKLAIRAALGRVAAIDIHSSLDVPGHTNSAMDGYAIRGEDIPVSDTREFTLIGTAWAGQPFQSPAQPGECVRIMTGAALPAGTDTVVTQEHVQIEGDRVRIGAGHTSGQNVRQAGEDLAHGQLVLAAGACIRPAELGLLASLGIVEVSVRRRLRVAFFSTGDELRSLGEPLDEGAVYDSNRYTLYGMLTRLGVDIIDMGVVRDTPQTTRQAFDEAADCADVVITSGGVSVGEADYIKSALTSLGAVDFWKVAMKPGRPLAFGRLKEACFFGLPGNPVSVMVTFYLFVQPALNRLIGREASMPLVMQVPCASRLKKRPGRVEYQRGLLTRDDSGHYQVLKTGAQGSGILRSMTEANCFILLPMESEGVEAGEPVEVLPFEAIV